MLGCPLLLAVTCVGLVPWFFTLRYMVSEAKSNGWYEQHIHSVYHAFLWWITPQVYPLTYTPPLRSAFDLPHVSAGTQTFNTANEQPIHETIRTAVQIAVFAAIDAAFYAAF